jgi:hypothetical protein
MNEMAIMTYESDELELHELTWALHASDWTSWSSGQHSCFVFWRSRIQISALIPAISNEVFMFFLSPSIRISE